jgi:hypothetical protein
LPEAIILAPLSGRRVDALPAAPAASQRLERVRSLLSLLRARATFRTM